jgi:hypothetical protein
MEGIALERVTGVYKDYYKAAIEIWKTTTSRGDQYIVIYHDTTKDGHMFDIKHLTQE